MVSPQDTIAAIATPLGESGLGIIRVSGASALSTVGAIFQSSKSIFLSTVPTQTCHLGRILSGATVVDQVVVAIFRAPHSYTGEDVVEISAHGNPVVLQRILGLCVKNGARFAEPGEFTQKAFLNGKMDLTQAEAVADLIRAKTDKAQAAALAQLEGHLAQRVRDLRHELLPLLAHVEVGLDHADEDHDFLSRERLISRCQAVQREIEVLLESAKVGKILREGLRVALVGRPNVGKSSLLNALLKQDRAIVAPIPGTTRDTLEEQVDWDGIPVVLVDTAGIRHHVQDPVERLGIERTRQALKAADLILCLLDRSQPLQAEDHAIVEECCAKPHLWVVNKCDLRSSWDLQELHQLNGHAATLSVSAKTGEGLQALVQQVKALSLQEKASGTEALWAINARHQDALERVQEALAHACTAAREDTFEECVALELKTALTALGEIIGETTTEDLLDQIFSKFCIGK